MAATNQAPGINEANNQQSQALINWHEPNNLAHVSIASNSSTLICDRATETRAIDALEAAQLQTAPLFPSLDPETEKHASHHLDLGLRQSPLEQIGKYAISGTNL